MYDNGIPDQYAAERLGHDIQTLKSIYQHIGAGQKTRLDGKVKGLLDAKKVDKKWTDTQNTFPGD
jgi:hypothetical protein